jgi:long-chain acyl-CoA synthetase
MRIKGMIPRHGLAAIPFKKALALGAKRPVEKPALSHDDLALLQYTGGTTGVSKGAMLLQRNILANMAQIQHVARGHVLDGQEVVLTALPLYHIFALSVNFLTFLAMGQRMLLVPKPVPLKNLIKVFKSYPITVMTGVNTLFNALANDKHFRAHPPASLKIALAGGMALQDAVNKHWQKLTGQPIIEGFGLTESSPVSHVNPLSANPRIGSVGIPVASTDAKVVDEAGQEVPIGEAGELLIKGPQVMAGYWQRPDETAKALRDGWLWTGDVAKRDEDGFFYIVDRKKDMILVSGFNVFPNEIEEVLVAHPKVLEAAVIGVPDAGSGEAVKAFVVPRDQSLTIDELRKHCSEQLTNYKRPRHFEFRKDLPKSNVGKILRRELRDEPKRTSA